MRKLFIFIISVSVTSVVVAFSSNSILAYHQTEVLGVSNSENLSFPPTAEGPGFVLPNSPLFFLDLMKQQTRLILAFTPEQKAKVHSAVAGERLAELQFMLAKDNVEGIRIALFGVSDNFKKAAENLTKAKLSGRNINLLAKSINDSIKEKQQKLLALEQKATGELKSQVQTARAALKIAKLSVEDSLPEDLLANEMADDLNQEIIDALDETAKLDAKVNNAIESLGRLGSKESEQSVAGASTSEK